MMGCHMMTAIRRHFPPAMRCIFTGLGKLNETLKVADMNTDTLSIAVILLFQYTGLQIPLPLWRCIFPILVVFAVASFNPPGASQLFEQLSSKIPRPFIPLWLTHGGERRKEGVGFIELAINQPRGLLFLWCHKMPQLKPEPFIKLLRRQEK